MVSIITNLELESTYKMETAIIYHDDGVLSFTKLVLLTDVHYITAVLMLAGTFASISSVKYTKTTVQRRLYCKCFG